MIKYFRSFIAGIICLACIFSVIACNGKGEDVVNPIEPPLYFNEDGEFVIVQFADFHEWASAKNTSSRKDILDSLSPLVETYIRTVLDTIQPDFVVLTGDNIFNLSWMDAFLKISAHTMTLFADIFEEKQVYWTYTFGNHDTEGGNTKEDYINATKPYKYCLSGIEDSEHYNALSYTASAGDYRAGNYSIPVYGKDKVSKAYNIFVLDSGSYNYVPSSSLPYRHILDKQVDWYASQAAALKAENQGETVPSLLFTHIPLLEHREAYQQGGGIGKWGGFSPSTNRSTIFERAMEVGDVRGIFVGHNHSNYYTGFYSRGDKKIMMGITPQASAESYEDTDSIMYSRVLRLNEDGNFTTYLHSTDTAKYPDGVYKGEYLSYK